MVEIDDEDITYGLRVRADNPENWSMLRDIEHCVNINLNARWLRKQRGRLNRISNWHLSPREIAYKHEIQKLILKKLKELGK